jgi:anti-anti-sigma regulatory factor
VVVGRTAALSRRPAGASVDKMTWVQVRRLNWVVILRPTTDLLGGPETEGLRATFRSAWAESYQGIAVNLSDVQRVNAVGMGALAGCVADARRTGTKLAFCCVSRSLDRILAAASMRWLKAFESEEDAIRFCSER